MRGLERYIELAYKASLNADHDQYHLGAILIHKGQVISIGSNCRKSHPIMKYKTLHAEIQSLLGVRWRDIHGSTMVVVRTNKNGKIGLGRPCSICQDILTKY